MTTIALLFSLLPLAAAQESPSEIELQTLLDQDAGWTLHKESGEVIVYTKPVPGLPVSAFKGVMQITVDPDILFDVIEDVDGAEKVSPVLHDSRVLFERDNMRHFYQVADIPLLSDRYWFNSSTAHMDQGGVDGHHKKTWRLMSPTLYPEAHTFVTERYPGAVAIRINHGSWEIVPAGDGKSLLVYRIISHPGGNVPDSLADVATSKSLPDNLRHFVAEAERRAEQP